MDEKPRIERLNRSHRTLIKDFQNSNPNLERYIKRFALRHHEKDFLSTTWLAVLSVSGDQKLAGFYTLSVCSVERTSVQSIESLQKLPNFPIPGVLLAQLAVDDRVRGQGLGRFLFEQALSRALHIQHEVLSCRLFITDAIDASAVAFYEHFGLKRVSPSYPARMVLDLKFVAQHTPKDP